LGAPGELTAEGSDLMVQHFEQPLLKFDFGPLRLFVVVEDLEGRVTRSCSAWLQLPYVQWVADDRV